MIADIGRRTILRILLTLPLALLFGCKLRDLVPAAKAQTPSPEDALRQLILLVGPWDERHRDQAEDFANRFLASETAVSPYLPASAAALQSIVGRLPSGEMAVDEINLVFLPGNERELLLQLTRQIYTYVEVRFFVNGEPPWGQCQSDPQAYTRAPV